MKSKIQHLQEENYALKKEIEFLRGHPDLAKGLKGETLISEMLSGNRTKNGMSYDVELTSTLRIEVKYSSLLKVKQGYPIRRWVWTKLFGELGKKSFDRLILVGDLDPNFSKFYRDASCPYVFFDLSYTDAIALGGGIKIGRTAKIELTTNPHTVRSPRSIALFNHYQTTIEELKLNYLSTIN